jgi:hypothetical protein
MSSVAEFHSDPAELRKRQLPNQGLTKDELVGRDPAGASPEEQSTSDGIVPDDKGKKTFGRTPDGTGALLDSLGQSSSIVRHIPESLAADSVSIL